MGDRLAYADTGQTRELQARIAELMVQVARKPVTEKNAWGPLVWPDGTVLGSFACPECDTDVAAKLIWIDRELVRCAECGTEYDPFRAWLGEDDEEVPDGE